jgi:hypothetical protein
VSHLALAMILSSPLQIIQNLTRRSDRELASGENFREIPQTESIFRPGTSHKCSGSEMSKRVHNGNPIEYTNIISHDIAFAL